MIELAPRHKYGLSLPTPVMPAAGIFGYGEAYRDLIDYGGLGAIVTHPVSLRARKAAHGTRLATRGEHLLVHTGFPNAGLRQVLREHRAFWAHQSLPVILHLLATTPPEVERACEILSRERCVVGVELGLDEGTPVEEALELLDAVRIGGTLPVIVRLPFGGVDALARPLAEAGADALTISAPPRALLPAEEEDDEKRSWSRGRFYGPALFPLLLHQLTRWVKDLPVPVVACGGIASSVDARACLDAGVIAVQVDAMIWRRPSLLEEVAAGVQNELDDRSTP